MSIGLLHRRWNMCALGLMEYVCLGSPLLYERPNEFWVQLAPPAYIGHVPKTRFPQRGRGHDRGRSRGRGGRCTCNRYHGGYNNDTSNHQKKNNNERQERSGQNNPSKIVENICYRYGMKRHWSHTCCMSKHLVKLYQASIKKKGKHMETNFISQNYEMETKDEDIHYNTKPDHAYKGDKFNDLNNITHLDVADFFENH
ncbi:hypothetical protein J1N35_010362 [Gossypium stocksii]|uniref:Uncharacterized protein n=1 Tax=Gossypium stocksii TaxID=47602 RepID=A0A9D3W095_9ROSI|nr:hypothetical protein J1N35_010362 [Gossypium stocksii]